jgi:hypothetical protein
MTIEKFVRRSKIIEAYLSEIACFGRQAEFGGMLQPFHPHFRAVVIAQEHLLNALERLLESRSIVQLGESSRTPYEAVSPSAEASFGLGDTAGLKLQRAS